jgi:hypothetical protein
MYLGDGCISNHPRSVFRLRITLDAIYPDIAAECAAAMEAVVPGKRSHLLWRRDQRSVEVSTYWKHWTCLIPQYGSGPKHMRRIVLTDWQSRLVTSHVEPLSVASSTATALGSLQRNERATTYDGQRGTRSGIAQRTSCGSSVTRVLAQVFTARAPARLRSPSTAKPRSLVSMSSLVRRADVSCAASSLVVFSPE